MHYQQPIGVHVERMWLTGAMHVWICCNPFLQPTVHLGICKTIRERGGSLSCTDVQVARCHANFKWHRKRKISKRTLDIWEMISAHVEGAYPHGGESQDSQVLFSLLVLTHFLSIDESFNVSMCLSFPSILIYVSLGVRIASQGIIFNVCAKCFQILHWKELLTCLWLVISMNKRDKV